MTRLWQTLRQADGRIVTAVRVGRDGRFSARRAPGRYRVRGRSPFVTQVSAANPAGQGREVPCTQPRTVQAVAGRAASVRLSCIVP